MHAPSLGQVLPLRPRHLEDQIANLRHWLISGQRRWLLVARVFFAEVVQGAACTHCTRIVSSDNYTVVLALRT